MISRMLYGAPDWFADRTSARLRRAVAFWTGMVMIFVITPLAYPVRNSVSVLWALSMLALILACFAMTAAETPVETEGDE
jgi:hypothetical protein